MFAVDLHTHTRFFHGYRGRPTRFDPIGADLLARFGRWQGLDAVALTNHDYAVDYRADSTDLTFIPGVEITTTDGHALVVGPDPPSRTTPGALSPHEAVALAHEQECAAIIAHPFRRSGLHASGADFDGVEVNGKHPHTIDRVEALAASLEVPIVGGSDAHFPFEVGRAFTDVDAGELTPASVAAAIRDGRVEPRVRHSRLNRLVQSGYGYLHRYVR